MEDKFEKALTQREKEEGLTFDENKSLGKVKTIQEEELTNRINNFENKVQKTLQADISNDLNISIGYTLLNLADLPSKGKFYDNNLTIQIKPATGRELEHWTTMNEQNPIDVDSHFKEIIKSCIKLKIGSRPILFGQLLEADKLYVLLAIQDKTFPDGENQVNLKVKCTSCGTDNKKKLNYSVLESNNEIDEILEKYYNTELKRYVVKTKSYGNIDLFPPTIGTLDFILRYVQNKTQENQYYNKALIQILPYLIEDYSDLNEKDILKAEMDFISWDKKKISLIYNFISKIKIGIKPTISYKCHNCESMEVAPVNFPDGPKALFLISNFEDELL